MASPKQIAANQANAQRSTGPRTPAGKARSRLNATRHGVTGQVVVATGEDQAAYRAHCDVFAKHYSPATPLECQTVQHLADIRWRLNRIAALEANLFSLTGHQSGFDTGNEQVDCALAQAQALPEQIASLATLSLYEQRLVRAFDKVLAHLRELQFRRRFHHEPAAPTPEPESGQPSEDGSGPAASVTVTPRKKTASAANGFVSSAPFAPGKAVPEDEIATAGDSPDKSRQTVGNRVKL